MILIISTCTEELSEMEFVKPLCELTGGKAKHYRMLSKKDIEKAEKIIISGTALKDFNYLQADWSWLKEYDKPVLGICAGMQVILKAFDVPLAEKTVIGPQTVEVVNENPLLEEDCSAYFLHTKTGSGNFKVLAKSSGVPCLIKHHTKEIYGCIFHPEVMNEEILENFVELDS